MSTYAPTPQPWHAQVPGTCNCADAWKGRGLVDDRCYWHRLIDAVEEMRDAGWQVEPKRNDLVEKRAWQYGDPDHA